MLVVLVLLMVSVAVVGAVKILIVAKTKISIKKKEKRNQEAYRWRGLADTMPRIRGSECNDVLVCLSMNVYLQSDHVISHLIGHVM